MTQINKEKVQSSVKIENESGSGGEVKINNNSKRISERNNEKEKKETLFVVVQLNDVIERIFRSCGGQ